MAIRRLADHDRLLNMKIENASFFEPWAQRHISHKYPHIENDWGCDAGYYGYLW
jgi:Zn-dependent oligopeptidase